MEKEEVKILNPIQACKYLKNGYYPKRLEVGYNDKIVFVYDKKETEQIFYDWINKRL